MSSLFDDARRTLGVLIAQSEHQIEQPKAAGSEGKPRIHLLCPRVGLWRGAPRVGQMIVADQSIGELEVLGRRHRLRAPNDAFGRVVEVASVGLARKAMQWGQTLLVLDPSGYGEASEGLAQLGQRAAAGASGNWLRSPSSGRFYHRPSPEQAAFIELGGTLESGATYGLLEVMKTFTRLNFQGDNLPARVRIAEIAVPDGGEVDADAPLLRWEPCDE